MPEEDKELSSLLKRLGAVNLNSLKGPKEAGEGRGQEAIERSGDMAQKISAEPSDVAATPLTMDKKAAEVKPREPGIIRSETTHERAAILQKGDAMEIEADSSSGEGREIPPLSGVFVQERESTQLREAATTAEPSEEELSKKKAKKTKWSEGAEDESMVVSIDEIKDISNLILPKGATFEVDEINLGARTSIFGQTEGIGTVPREIDDLWKASLPSGALADIGVKSEKEAAKSIKDRFKAFSISKMIRPEVEEYNPKIHGPLVDLTMKPQTNIEEVELYPVNEPYAYIRVILDNSTHEYTYQVLEPVLTQAERELLMEIKERLFETLDVNTKDLTREMAKKVLRSATDDIIYDYGLKLSPVAREKILYNIEKDFIGDGLIDPIMHDKYIEDISCDGVKSTIFVYHTSYENIRTNLMYESADDLDSFVTKLAQRAGKYISIAEPMLDATMSDGSRIQMTLGREVTAHGSTFTIRKFREEPITPTDLIEWGTFSPLGIAFFWLAVESGKSCIFAGGTASGKTTSLNAISLFIPPNAKIVSLEDTRELKLPHPNWIPSITRQSFDSAGRGEIDMYELLRAALRQRPEYLLVGEVRGREALTLFQAMSTGHVTYSTIHADSVASVVHRLENPPINVPRNMLSALNLVSVQVQARIGGQRIRRQKQLIEILDIDPRTNELITNEVFRWVPATDEIRYSGKSFLLEEIMEEKGWNEARMKEELKRRQELLEWMRLKMIRHYKDVSKMLISYYRDPEAVMDIVRKDLYE
ncbi:MAG: type II/IV secretion system ATPase subunit [Methanomicrobiales archaeon]|nr:type II/IV secretion system ATPase subunit [Methanomicrobiales archaeon]